MTGVPLAVVRDDLDAEEIAAVLMTLATFVAPDVMGGGARRAGADPAGDASPHTRAGRIAPWSLSLDATPVSWSSRTPGRTPMDW